MIALKSFIIIFRLLICAHLKISLWFFTLVSSEHHRFMSFEIGLFWSWFLLLFVVDGGGGVAVHLLFFLLLLFPHLVTDYIDVAIYSMLRVYSAGVTGVVFILSCLLLFNHHFWLFCILFVYQNMMIISELGFYLPKGYIMLYFVFEWMCDEESREKSRGWSKNKNGMSVGYTSVRAQKKLERSE